MLEAKLASKTAIKMELQNGCCKLSELLTTKTIKSLYNLGTTEGCLSLFTRPHYCIAWKTHVFQQKFPNLHVPIKEMHPRV